MLLLYVFFFLALATFYVVAKRVDTPASYATAKAFHRFNKRRALGSR
ncbi:MAG TPA: hypothetical protein VG501_08475 [Rhizomicrobium sp.]|nr:hypothetical protein [Rhizomicrobium sp.]